MTTWRALAFVVVLQTVAGGQAIAAQRGLPAPPGSPPSAPAPAPTPAPLRPAVSARAWLDADQIPESGHVKVWIVIDNQGSQPLDDLHFEALRLHGFEQVGGCWREQTPACPADSSNAVDDDALPASRQLVRWAEWKRVQSDNGKSLLFGSLLWKNGVTNEASHATVTAASVQLVSATRPVSATELLALIGLSGTAITLIVQMLMQRRGERQALFTTLLPTNLKSAQSHYLPIQSSASQIVAIADSPPIVATQLTFYCLQLSRRMRHMQQKAGSFYFKSYAGEEVAAAAWDEYKTQETRQGSAAGQPIPTTLMFKVVGSLEPTSNLADFRQKRLSDAALDTDTATLELGFAQWVTNDSWAFAVVCLKILGPVLLAEINRPHERWYEDDFAKEQTRDELRACAEALEKLTFGGDLEMIAARNKLLRTLQAYLDQRWSEGGLAD